MRSHTPQEEIHTSPSLATLVRRAQKGDRASYDKIVARFAPMALAYGVTVVGDRQIAEDAAQEAFVEAYLHLASLTEPLSFPGWFRTIVYRQCHRILRRRQVPTVPLTEAFDLVWDTLTPAQAAEMGEMQTEMNAAIGELAEPERMAVTLYYLGEQSVGDVAAFLSLPVNTIKKRLQSARRKLKERLIPLMPEVMEQEKAARDAAFANRVRQMLDAASQGKLETVKSLLKIDPAIARVAENEEHTSPLHAAVESNNAQIVEALIAAGADVNRRTNTWHTPLSWAITMRSFDVAEALLRGGANVDLWCAAGLGRLDAVRSYWDAQGRLADHPSHTGSSRYDDKGNLLPRPPKSEAEVVSDALYIASRNGHTETARWLLDHGADTRFRAYLGGTPLHYAYWSGEPAMVELLLARGADPNALDDGFAATPINFGITVTSDWGILWLVHRILDRGLGSANATSGQGTPLQRAAANGHREVVALLLERGADPTMPNSAGKTALDLAKENGHGEVVTLLESRN